MTVRYRSATLGEFIEHHSYDVSRGGMFIKTPSPFPAGTLLKFEVKIAEEQRLMQGVGRVVWKREGDQSSPDAPAGMGIKFIKIDEASHAVIERLVENRGHGGPSAFDQSAPAGGSKGPSKSQRMFPEHTPSSPPAVDGEAPPPPGVGMGELEASSSPSIEAQPSSDESVSDSDAPTSSGASAAEEGPKVTRPGATKAKPAAQAKIKQKRASGANASPAGDPAAASANKAPGKRWFLAVLLVILVLGMLYVLTHKSEQPALGMGTGSVPAGAVSAGAVPAGLPLRAHIHVC